MPFAFPPPWLGAGKAAMKGGAPPWAGIQRLPRPSQLLAAALPPCACAVLYPTRPPLSCHAPPSPAVRVRERMVSYLPLSHIAAAMLDVYGPLIVGYCVYFARPDALRGSLVDTLRHVQPTIFFGVPRVWEKIMEQLQAVGSSKPRVVQCLAAWAKRKVRCG